MGRGAGHRWWRQSLLLGLVMAGALACASLAGPPMPADPEGAALYARHCASCHGVTGAGNGPAAATLRVKTTNFRTGPFHYTSSVDDEPSLQDLAHSIYTGRSDGVMPPAEGLDDEQVRRVAAYVLALRRLGRGLPATADGPEAGTR